MILDAMNYAGIIFILLLSFVGLVIVGGIIGERVERAKCRRRHPASVGRRVRIVSDRRARLDGRGR